MEMEEYIPINVFCSRQGIETTIINSLQDFGLIEVTTINDANYIHLSQLAEAEKLLRLFSDLEINLEGIDVITHLLNRIHAMQLEIQQLKNKLGLYED
jgi:hypothetical protein